MCVRVRVCVCVCVCVCTVRLVVFLNARRTVITTASVSSLTRVRVTLAMSGGTVRWSVPAMDIVSVLMPQRQVEGFVWNV